MAEEIGVKIGDIKTCLLALVNGARSVLRKKNTIPNILGTEKADKLFNHPFYFTLKKDIKDATEVLLQKAKKRGNYFINQMGKSINSNNKKSEIVAHLLQGYEARMLNLVLNLHSDKIIVLQHDGWISQPNINVQKIENAIKEQLDINITINKALEYSKL